MNEYLTAGAVLLVLLAAALLSWRRAECTIRRLDQMLRAAMAGGGHPVSPEQGMSELERRLEQYLAAERVSAQEARVREERVNTLLADLSRVTREPVAEVQACARQLARQPLTPQGRDCVQTISRRAQVLQTRIEALVTASQLETGGLSLHPQEDDLAPVVRRAAARYAPRAWDKEVSLKVGKAQGRAFFDAKWTEEALCGLLDNAVKYTAPGGEIHVEVLSGEEGAAVRISDTGPGIPEQEQARIFQRFYQAPQGQGEPGAGMGLYVSRFIAEKQGGSLQVESVLGKGSAFSLSLPGKEPPR